MPGSAAGPDLRRLVLGSEGTLGIVTEVTLRVQPIPAATRYEGWVARSWDDGVRIMRRLAQEGPKPDIVRLSDRDETAVSLALSGTAGLKRRGLDGWLRVHGIRGGCLIIVGFEGSSRDVRHRRQRGPSTAARRARGDLGARAPELVGAPPVRRAVPPRHLARRRRAGRDARDRDHLVTAARPVSAVSDALKNSLPHNRKPPLIGCHISHLYPTGGSLYFTVLAHAESGREIEQWSAAKHAANEAIVAAGGTASHHHAVGTAHREIVATDLGGTDGVGVEALRALKAYLDPAGILNPGKLLP